MSDKHGPRLDEQMKGGARGTSETLNSDDLAEGERLGDAGVGKGSPIDEGYATSGPIGDDEAERRSELARFVTPASFPASKHDLIEAARREFATEDVLERLAGLPDDATFENVQDVWQKSGGDVEHGHT